ncbi:MAG: hypothetical protein PHT60_15805 [Acidiphilium sp.]|nr:hypothetical protein [Acidiphilium sp.]
MASASLVRRAIRTFLSPLHLITALVTTPATGFGLLFLAGSLIAGHGSPTFGAARLFHDAASSFPITPTGFLVSDCKFTAPAPHSSTKPPLPMPCTAPPTKAIDLAAAASAFAPAFWFLYVAFVLFSFIVRAIELATEFTDKRRRARLFGIYDGVSADDLLTDKTIVIKHDE